MCGGERDADRLPPSRLTAASGSPRSRHPVCGPEAPESDPGGGYPGSTSHRSHALPFDPPVIFYLRGTAQTGTLSPEQFADLVPKGWRRLAQLHALTVETINRTCPGGEPLVILSIRRVNGSLDIATYPTTAPEADELSRATWGDSLVTCERCGRTGRPRQLLEWQGASVFDVIVTRCDSCTIVDEAAGRRGVERGISDTWGTGPYRVNPRDDRPWDPTKDAQDDTEDGEEGDQGGWAQR
jgi:hypothetical protein